MLIVFFPVQKLLFNPSEETEVRGDSLYALKLEFTVPDLSDLKVLRSCCVKVIPRRSTHLSRLQIEQAWINLKQDEPQLVTKILTEENLGKWKDQRAGS